MSRNNDGLPMLPPWLSESDVTSGYEAPVQNLPHDDIIDDAPAPRRKGGKSAAPEGGRPDPNSAPGRKDKRRRLFGGRDRGEHAEEQSGAGSRESRPDEARRDAPDARREPRDKGRRIEARPDDAWSQPGPGRPDPRTDDPWQGRGPEARPHDPWPDASHPGGPNAQRPDARREDPQGRAGGRAPQQDAPGGQPLGRQPHPDGSHPDNSWQSGPQRRDAPAGLPTRQPSTPSAGFQPLGTTGAPTAPPAPHGPADPNPPASNEATTRYQRTHPDLPPVPPTHPGADRAREFDGLPPGPDGRPPLPGPPPGAPTTGERPTPHLAPGDPSRPTAPGGESPRRAPITGERPAQPGAPVTGERPVQPGAPTTGERPTSQGTGPADHASREHNGLPPAPARPDLPGPPPGIPAAGERPAQPGQPTTGGHPAQPGIGGHTATPSAQPGTPSVGERLLPPDQGGQPGTGERPTSQGTGPADHASREHSGLPPAPARPDLPGATGERPTVPGPQTEAPPADERLLPPGVGEQSTQIGAGGLAGGSDSSSAAGGEHPAREFDSAPPWLAPPAADHGRPGDPDAASSTAPSTGDPAARVSTPGDSAGGEQPSSYTSSSPGTGAPTFGNAPNGAPAWLTGGSGDDRPAIDRPSGDESASGTSTSGSTTSAQDAARTVGADPVSATPGHTSAGPRDAHSGASDESGSGTDSPAELYGADSAAEALASGRSQYGPIPPDHGATSGTSGEPAPEASTSVGSSGTQPDSSNTGYGAPVAPDRPQYGPIAPDLEQNPDTATQASGEYASDATGYRDATAPISDAPGRSGYGPIPASGGRHRLSSEGDEDEIPDRHTDDPDHPGSGRGGDTSTVPTYGPMSGSDQPGGSTGYGPAPGANDPGYGPMPGHGSSEQPWNATPYAPQPVAEYGPGTPGTAGYGPVPVGEPGTNPTGYGPNGPATGHGPGEQPWNTTAYGPHGAAEHRPGAAGPSGDGPMPGTGSTGYGPSGPTTGHGPSEQPRNATAYGPQGTTPAGSEGTAGASGNGPMPDGAPGTGPTGYGPSGPTTGHGPSEQPWNATAYGPQGTTSTGPEGAAGYGPVPGAQSGGVGSGATEYGSGAQGGPRGGEQQSAPGGPDAQGWNAAAYGPQAAEGRVPGAPGEQGWNAGAYAQPGGAHRAPVSDSLAPGERRDPGVFAQPAAAQQAPIGDQPGPGERRDPGVFAQQPGTQRAPLGDQPGAGERRDPAGFAQPGNQGVEGGPQGATEPPWNSGGQGQQGGPGYGQPAAGPAGQWGTPQPQYQQGGHPHPSLDDVPLRRAKKSPGSGWRKAVHHVSGGAINPGMSAEERRLQELVARIRQPVRGDYRIAVLSLKGGVGKTTTTMGLGSIFASVRGDRVIAVDANPDFGTLSQRVPLQTRSTVRDLLLDPAIERYSDVRRHTSQATSRLEVLASERDPAASEAFNDEEYRAVARILQRFYNIILTDCGTGLMHSAMTGVLDLAHSLVLISSAAIDGARSAAATLDWLSLHGHDHLVRNAVVVINLPREGSPNVGIQQLREYFLSRCRAVHIIPYDSHLSEGAEIDLHRLSKQAKRAYVELAATVADEFGVDHRRYPI
ncbi:AAA family ATPase [Nocardia sp. NPDC050710]|uniref:nucleotide-binding protein n=1 Tax=Nocardia sp. NPDC050710 TaxID=3157220 RepID=UPI0033DD752A